jgi:hypothetical protein
MRAAVLMAIAATAFFFASCTAKPADSGITGLVTLGPTAPVRQVGEPSDRPYSATLIIKDKDGHTVATVTSDAGGRFSVDLPGGTYELQPQSPGVLPFAPPQEVIASLHEYSQVTVAYDSGIR